MKGWRKFIISIVTIIAFSAILMVKQYDPFALGAGFGTFLATVMFGYYGEYKHNEK